MASVPSQLRVDAELVRGLLQAQQPQLADQTLAGGR